MHKRVVHVKKYKSLRHKDGSLVQFLVDQYPALDFNRNKYGHPRSDVSLFLDLSTRVLSPSEQALYKSVADRMQAHGAGDFLSPDVDLEQAFAAVVPNTMQTPYEYAKFTEYINEYRKQHEVSSVVESPTSE